MQWIGFVITFPKKVVINEAVELAKEFGGPRSYAFINGVLGGFMSELPEDTDKKTSE